MSSAKAADEKAIVIDLRSDTVTKPTPEMRRAMAEAEVGDDVMGDDPTVNRLQEQAAKLFGKEAALFVTSGTMGNLLCALVHCERRDAEMIVGNESHMHMYEHGNSAQLGGIHSRVLPTNADGTLNLKDIEEHIRTVDDHYPTTQLVCLENTHNRMGGVALTAAYTNSVGALCRRYGLKLHIDGARIMNAAIALGVPVAQLVAAADSVTMCLSKGLASPVGSLIAGTREFITKARRLRKALGGGMRQVGVLAACGIVSLERMCDRLADDHANAKLLGDGLSAMDGIVLDASTVKTNIVYFHVDPSRLRGADAKQTQAALRERGVWCGVYGPTRLRMITHYHISADSIRSVLQIVADILARFRTAPAAPSA
jgi:threonine aldolase